MTGLDLPRVDQNYSNRDQFPDLGIPPLNWVWISGKNGAGVDGIPRQTLVPHEDTLAPLAQVGRPPSTLTFAVKPVMLWQSL